jgi:hypothetical protein
MGRQQGWTDALPSWKTAPDSTSQPSWVACGTHLCFSPNTTTEAVRLSQVHVDGRLLSLLGLYHQHAISTFNTCSQGPTHRSLTDTGRATTLDVPSHDITLLDVPNRRSSTFLLRAPLGLRSNIQQLPIDLETEQTLNLASGGLHSTSTEI